ncbi:MAG: hypothetical protein K2I10_02180, partial [Lachnospiraceae bacterium]|nr:hypothetical protein [Lachnospiraceae bacterium]
YTETGSIYYSQELLVQVAACATLSIATKLLSNKLTELKEKVGVHNHEFLYSNKQSLYYK